MLFVIPIIVLLGAALGVARSRARQRADTRFALATAHRHLPELLVLAPVAILATLGLMLLLRNCQLTWYLPVVVDRWRDLLLWTLSSGTFSYLAGISGHISFARREPERYKLLFATIVILGSLGYMQIQGAWPIASLLTHQQTTEGYVLQTSAYSCAAASLANVARYHGIPATEKHMAKLAGTTRSGTSAGEILHALQQIGLHGIKRQATIADLSAMTNPCILLVEIPGAGPDSHAIVLLPSSGSKRLLVVDPSHGLETRSADSLAAVWRGHLIECPGIFPGHPVNTGDGGTGWPRLRHGRESCGVSFPAQEAWRAL